MQPAVEDRPRFTFTGWWMAHPLIGLLGTIASLVAIPLAVYLFFASQLTRELTITSDPPVAIIRGDQMSSVDILYHGEKLKTDVYARQIYLWNAGTDSIRREHVLDPVVLSIPNARILEAHLKKVSRPLIGMTINTTGDRVVPSWNILEHNDGVAIVIIYASADAGKLAATGTVEHQHELRVQENTSSSETFLQGWKLVVGYLFIGLISLSMMGTAIILTIGAIQTARKEGLNFKEVLAVWAILIILGGGGGWMMWLLFYFGRVEIVPPIL